MFRSILTRRTVVAVVATIVAGSLAVIATPVRATAAPACAAQRADAASAAALASSCGSRVEVLAGRSEYTQVFANPDGTSTFVSTAVPARVHRPDGSWVPVDTSLRKRADGTLAPVAAVSDVVFSAGGSGPFVTYRDGGSALTLSLPMVLPKPTVEGASAVYRNVLPDVDLRVSATATGFTHVLVVKTPAAAANEALSSIRYGVGGDALAKPMPDGRVAFAGKAGHTMAVTASASMWDSAVNPGLTGELRKSAAASAMASLRAAPPAELVSTEHGPGATAVSAPVAVRADTGGHGVVLVPDRTLLRGTGTVFPVFIDPSVGPQRTKWAYANNINSNWDVTGQAWIGRNPTGGALYRSYFDFPTSYGGQTYLGKHVLAASFSIELDHSWSCGDTSATLYRTGGITVGNAGRMGWGDRPLGPSATYLATAVGHGDEAGGCGAIQPDMLMTFGGNEGMRADVQIAANDNWGGYTVGLCACDPNGANEAAQDRWKRFYIDERVTMSVTFNTVPGTPANLSPYQGQVACGGVIGTSTPILQAQYLDADGSDTLSATFNWQELPSGPVNSVPGPAKPANNNGAVTINLGAVADGKQFQFQVRTNDGVDSSPWSPWCPFTVDTAAPDTPIVTAVASGSAPVYTACDPQFISTCVARGGPGIAGAFRFSEPATTTDVVKYVYGWDAATTQVTVAQGAAYGPVLLTPPHYGLNKLTVYGVDASGKASPTATFVTLVSAPSAPLAYWPLDNIRGHDYTDQISGSALATTGVNWTQDAHYRGASAATFGGTGAAIQSVPAFDTSGSFSVAASARFASTSCSGNQTVASVDADSVTANNHNSAFFLGYDCANQRWRMRVSDANKTIPATAEAVSPNGSAVVGRWTMLVGTYDEDTNQISLWIDGILAQTTQAPSSWLSSHGGGWRATGKVVIGRDRLNDTDGGRFSGEIADVRLWNRVVVNQDIVGTVADAANGVPAQVGLTAPVQVGWWQFGDGECYCADALDGSYFGRPMTIAPNWTLDPAWNGDILTTPAWLTADSQDGNGGLRLDGATGRASTTDDLDTLSTADDVQHPVLRTDQSFTVGAWVKLTAVAGHDQVVLQQGSGSSAFKLFAGGADNQWHFALSTPDGSGGVTWVESKSTAAVQPGAWVNLVGEFDASAGKVRLYVNGSPQPDSPAGGRGWNSTGSLTIGSLGTSDFFGGTVDQVEAWQGLKHPAVATPGGPPPPPSFSACTNLTPPSFGGSNPSFVDGHLYREPSGAIVVILGGAPFSFASMAELQASGYNAANATNVGAGTFSSLPQTPRNGSYFILPDGSVFGVVGGARIWMGSWSEHAALGSPPVIPAPASSTARLPGVPANGTYVRTPNGSVYAIIGGAKVWVGSPVEFPFLGNPSILMAPTGGMDAIGTVPAGGTYVQTADGAVYGMIGGAKVRVGSPNDLPFLGNPTRVCAPMASIAALGTVPANGTYVRTPDGSVYGIIGGAKVWVGSPVDFPFLGNPVVVSAPEAGINALRNVPVNGTYVMTPDGSVYGIIGGAKVWVGSSAEFPFLGNPTLVHTPSAGVNNIGNAPANGTFVRIPDGTVYGIVGAAKFQVSSAYLPQFGNPTPVPAPSAGINAIGAVPAYGTLINAVGDATIYQMVNGKRRLLTTEDYVALGQPPSNKVTVAFLNSIPTA